MQAISPISIQERHRNQSFGAHAQNRKNAMTREIYNERILNAIREKEQTAQPGTVFYNAMQTDTYQKTRSLADLNDEQLKTLSKALAAKDDKHKLGAYQAALIGIPALDTFARAANATGPLSTKISTAGRTAGSWAGAFLLAGLYNGATNKIAAVSPVVRKFGDDHPVLASLLNLAGFGGVLYGAQKGLDLLISKSKQAFPAKMVEHVRNFSQNTALRVNTSLVNTKVIQPVAAQITKATSRFPNTTVAAKYALGLGAFAWASGIIFKAITDRVEHKSKSNEILGQLKNARQANINALGSLLAADKLKEKLVSTVTKAAQAEIDEAKAIKEARIAAQSTEEPEFPGEGFDRNAVPLEEIPIECDCDDCDLEE